jgi:hypothetical protein
VQLPKDVTGWGKIKWGMTVAQATALLGDTVIPENAPAPNITMAALDPYPAKLRLQDVQIGLEHGTVAIQTKQNSDVVWVVTLLASPPAEETYPGRRADVFDSLHEMLIEKYGSPTIFDRKSFASSGSSENIVTTVVWTFPSTYITLKWRDGAYHVGYVSIEYRAVDKKALDTL